MIDVTDVEQVAAPAAGTDPLRQLVALRRVALAVARPSPPSTQALLHELLAELAEALPAMLVLVAVFADDTHDKGTYLRTLAVRLQGQAVPDFEYPLQSSPCRSVVGAQFRYLATGVTAEIGAEVPLAGVAVDAYAAFPLNDSRGAPLGVLAALDLVPIAGGDASHAEVMLKVVAGRLAGELERQQTLNVLRDAALAVSRASGETVFDELARLLARSLQVEFAFIARHDASDPDHLTMMALHGDGRTQHGLRYALAPTPCRTVLGQQFRAYPRDLATRFPDDPDVLGKGAESYAGLPLTGSDGQPLGVIAVGSRKPLVDLPRIEALLEIFAVRAGAEIERLHALDALRRSEASYRAIFDSAASAIYVHDWDTFALIDVNQRACDDHGRTREEMLAVRPSELLGGEAPYDLPHALEKLQTARLGRCPPFEWQVRPQGGALRWWEIHLKPAQLNGRACILAFTHDITERKRAETQLRASEEQYRAIFNVSADALMLWDNRLKRVDVNPAHQKIFGYARDDVVGRGFEGLDYPEELAEARLEMVRRALAGEASRAEVEAQRKGGQRIVTELRTIPFQHRGEAHVLQIARDITERKQAEARLRASEAQYRAIFDASADALILWDREYRRVDVNAAYERIYGWRRQEVVGRGFEVYSEASGHVEPRRELVRRALAGETCRAELEGIDRAGRRIVTEIHTIPFQHRGEPHVLAIARDVTERKRSEEQLREREEQYRAIFDGSADAMVLWNDKLEVADVNQAFVRMKGIAREHVVGRPWSTRPDAADMPTLLPYIRAALDGRESQLVQRVSHADGRTMDMELRYLPVRIGGESFALGIGRNITERLQLESQLRQAQKMEAIGQLTGGIAHDFNNILTSVLGYVSMARERAEAGTDARLLHQLGQARLATERARDLVAQMLAFARRKGGARQRLALARLVRESLGMLRATLPSSVLLEVDAEGSAVAEIEADAVQIGQVLMNLVINARDAVSGAGQVRVSLRAASGGGWRCRSCGEPVTRGHWMELAVADDGCGIAPATLERMFDPFFSTKPAGQGTGMGLAMVHGIVHDHGGHIGVETVVGQGTMFRILLPAVTAAGSSLPERGGDGESAASVSALPLLQGRVLVVEDDALVGDFLREQLETWGLQVVLRRDAREALAWLERGDERLDLLLTDLTMPHLSGLQLARHATQLRPGLPVLLVSGDLVAADAEERVAAGVCHTLGKPLDAGALRQVLLQVLGGADRTSGQVVRPHRAGP